MHDLLTNPTRRRQLGDAGRQVVREHFTDEHMAREMLRVYEGVLV